MTDKHIIMRSYEGLLHTQEPICKDFLLELVAWLDEQHPDWRITFLSGADLIND